jgi:hypothetical protein
VKLTWGPVASDSGQPCLSRIQVLHSSPSAICDESYQVGSAHMAGLAVQVGDRREPRDRNTTPLIRGPDCNEVVRGCVTHALT